MLRGKYAQLFLICIAVILLTGCAVKEQQQESKYVELKEKIHACHSTFKGWDGKIHTVCYDTAGKKLFDEPYDILSELDFSKAEIENLTEEFKHGCASELPFIDIPPSAITDAILKTDLFKDKTICENIDKSIYSWKHNNHLYRYSKEYSGGGNFRGYIWSLEIEPYTTEELAIEKYPFLACESFSAHKMHAWSLNIEKEDNTLTITTDNIRPAEAENLDIKGINQIAKNFTDCNIRYDYYRISKENTYN